MALPVVAEVASDDVIEELVVTADFRDVGASQIPASVSVIKPDEVASSVHHLEEVLGRAANVNLASGASRARFIQIRGIGERGQFGDPLNSSVGLIVDGVDLSGIGTAATLFDVQQVEVLRGPQGTLYGANALAGLVNVVTAAPTTEHTAKLRLDGGDHEAFGVGAVLSGPLSDQVGYRLVVHSYRDNGFMDNNFLGRDDTDNHDEMTFRGKLVWTGEQTDWELNLGRIDVDNGYDAFSLDNNRNTLSDQPGQDQQVTDFGSLRMSWDVSDSVTFEASLAFAESDIAYGYDEDWTFTGFDPIGYTSTDFYGRDRETTTLEARWLSAPGEGWFDGKVDWVFGAYALRQDVDLQRIYTFASGDFFSEFEIERVAVYGEISQEIGEGLRLTVGARAERHQSDYSDSSGVSFDPSDDLFGGRILLEKTLASGNLLYGGVTRGYKSGGFNTDGSLAADLREFDPETLWNIEVGYKGRAWDDRLRYGVTLFRMQRDDVQLSTSTERLINGGPAVEFIVFNGNAAEGYNQGLEFEATWDVTEQLTLFGSVGLLDTEYEDFIDPSGRDLDGRDQAHAPAYQFFVGAQYTFGDGWFISIEAEGKDEFFFSASHSEESDAYELLHAAVGYRGDSWSARLWGRNLTDEDYAVRGFFFGNDPRDFYTARPFTQLGEPRQIGVSVEMSF